MNKTQHFEKVFKRAAKAGNIFEAVLLIENSNGDFSYNSGYGGKHIDSPLFMASITKLFTSSIIIQLMLKNKLSLDDGLSKYFDSRLLQGLHIYKGTNYSSSLTLGHLLFQASGFPDAFEETSNINKRIKSAGRFNSSFEELVSQTKKLKPHFPPCNDKAFYSNFNFDLLGKVIEKIEDSPLNEVFEKSIFDLLMLDNTYIPTSDEDFIPKIYFKDAEVQLSEVILASPASGAGVSSAKDLMTFLKAFFNGGLFDKAVFNGLSNYRKLQMGMGPVFYGGGYMQIPLEGATTFFQGKGELLGHSGSAGSFAFYYPQKDLFFVGDINQMASPATPIRLAIQLAMSAK